MGSEEIAKLVATESPLIKLSDEHKVYCLDTTNFDNLVDTTFKNKLTSYMVRKWLADNEFTKVSKDKRYTYQLQLDGKLVKPICFYQEELLSYIESITEVKEPEPATV